MRKCLQILLSVALCAAMLAGMVSGAFALPEERAPLQVGVVSDIHYFSERMTGGYCEPFMQWQETDFHERYETPALLDSALAALAAHAEENGMKYVLIPGDLSANGEYYANVGLSERLNRFEEETGLSVIVINGNHDINNYNGMTFEGGKKKSARLTTPEEYLELYKNLGYDLAYHTFTPKNGRAGMMSYSVQLDGGYRLIVLDVCRYTSDVSPKGKDYAEVGGQITDELMQWALDEIADAQANGEAVIGMQHHSIVEHHSVHSDVFQPFLVDNWKERAEALADAGLTFMLTGHIHDLSVTDYVSDAGNVIYDISTATLTGFPNCFREIRFDNTGDILTADIQTFDVDCVQPVTVRGVEFPTPFRYYSFTKSFKNSLSELALSGLTETLDKLFDCIDKEGGLIPAVKTMYKIDVAALMDQYVNVQLGSVDILTSENVMHFLSDLDSQICSKILISRADTEDLIRRIIDKAMEFKVSDLPCTKYLDTYGFGHTSGPSTFEDAAYSALVVLYSGNQTIDDDPMLQDVIRYFREGTGGADFTDFLVHVILDDVLQDALLSKLQFNINTLFPSGTLGHVSMDLFDDLLSLALGGDKSYTNVINSILGLGVIPQIKDIDSAANFFISKVATPAQEAAWGETIAGMIEALVTDCGDGEDLTRTLVPTPRTPEATRENYRLPTMVTVTPGADPTARSISWYTRFSVTGSDVEIVPYSENPSFSGSPTRSGVRTSCERHDRTYPGVDFGLVGMMYTAEPMNRHTAEITGLEKGKSYCFRVGDAEKGWWSEPGVLRIANDDALTFLHIADPQLQSSGSEGALRAVLQSARTLYPDASLIVSSGDQVMNGENYRQWARLPDGLTIAPSAGSHEDSGSAISENFLLPGAPEQDTEKGVYYAFDSGNVHFMVLNTNDVTSKDGLSDAQLAWLKDSAAQSGATWKIVVLHKAPYTAGLRFGSKENDALRKQLKKLLPELGVDLVLEGQDKVYLRTGSLYGGVAFAAKTHEASAYGNAYTVQTDPCGVTYVLSGTAGNAPGKQNETDALVPMLVGGKTVEETLPMFSGVRVTGNTLYLDAYAVAADGSARRIDSLAIEKTGAKKAPAEAAAEAQPLPAIGTLEDLDMVHVMSEIDDEYDLVPDPNKSVPINGTEDKPADPSDPSKPADPSDPGTSGDTDTNKPGEGNSNPSNPSGGTDPSKPSADDKTPSSFDGTPLSGGSSSGTTGEIASGGSARTGGTQSSGGESSITLPSASSGSAASDSASSGAKTRSGLSALTGSDADSADADASASGSSGTRSGSTSSGSSSFFDSGSGGTMTTFSGTGIPKLGGSVPVAAVSVLFGAMLTALLTFRKKEDDE